MSHDEKTCGFNCNSGGDRSGEATCPHEAVRFVNGQRTCRACGVHLTPIDEAEEAERRPSEATNKPLRSWGGCNEITCCSSTGIHEGLTFGRGKLDDQGYWEIPCATCARAFEKAHPEDAPCWPFEPYEERVSETAKDRGNRFADTIEKVVDAMVAVGGEAMANTIDSPRFRALVGNALRDFADGLKDRRPTATASASEAIPPVLGVRYRCAGCGHFDSETGWGDKCSHYGDGGHYWFRVDDRGVAVKPKPRPGVPPGAHRPEYMHRAKAFCEEWTNPSDDEETNDVVCELEAMLARAFTEGWDEQKALRRERAIPDVVTAAREFERRQTIEACAFAAETCNPAAPSPSWGNAQRAIAAKIRAIGDGPLPGPSDSSCPAPEGGQSQ